MFEGTFVVDGAARLIGHGHHLASNGRAREIRRMPLDPEAKVLLDQLAAVGGPPITEQTVEQARLLMDSLAALNADPEPVQQTDELTIPGPAGDIPARTYRPGDGLLPVVVYFHGGGWVIGSLDSHDATCRALANRSGAVVVSVDYRLAPEHRFPAAADDAYAATAWVAAQAAELNVDAGRLAVAGDSAGGNLAAVVAQMARDRKGPAIAFQVLVYPVTDCEFTTVSYRENADGYLLTRDAMQWFWNHYCGEGERTNAYASPLRGDARGLPRALVVTAEFDPLRDEGEAYGRRLAEAGVAVDCRRYDGMIHGFFGMTRILGQAKQAVDDVGAVLKTTLAQA
jgi:acetyl esterase